MREQSLNAFINRKMFSLFIIMVLVVLSIVYFLTDAFLERVVDNHVHDVTFNIIFSSLKQISNSDDIFRELASIQENFPFIRQISVYSSPELTGNTLFNLPAGRDRDIFGTLTELDSSYRMKLDSYSFAYYLRWDNQGGSG
ncbi:MAG TPA: hypothetical protein GXZ20_08075 [Halanaerobiaceae bacterium]|nr:hypothetical protein [Bacillota bacterium]HHU93071.1 hypothetical protein [Halanaerobiaceae bacterium]